MIHVALSHLKLPNEKNNRSQASSAHDLDGHNEDRLSGE